MPASKDISENALLEEITFLINASSNHSYPWKKSSTSLDDQSASNKCLIQKEVWHSSFFGVTLALPEWEAILTVFLLSIIIVLTIVGNILVILSVFTYKPLRIVQNFFIVSLGVADLTVALLVLPFNVAYSILGRWEFGIHICKLWLTCDVMCCTSSILNLCVIALDRFWAITDPINYAHKRTVNRVLFLIAGVWILSFLISSPPLIGWNDWPEEFTSTTPCELTSNRGYVIYSSLGSFFIPLIIMTIVYIQIYIAAKKRLRERSLASKFFDNAIKSSNIEEKENRSVRESSGLLKFCFNLPCFTKPNTRFESPSAENENASSTSEPHTSLPQKQTSFEEPCNEKIPDKKLNYEEYESVALANLKSNVIETKASKGQDIDLGFSPKILDNTESAVKSSLIEPNIQVTLEKEKPCVYQFIEEKQKISLSKERRAARTLGIIMGVFVFCWLPFFLMYVILPFCDECCPTQKVKNFVTWLGYINSSLNPFIYTIFNLDFRRAFKRLLGLKY